jgi:hypothetical protein
MAEHRVPMLGGALRRRVDPTKSADPQVRELVAALATLDVAPAPRPDFRAELRAQLVAVTPRFVAEGNAEVKAEATPAAPAPERERTGARFKKPLIALVGAAAAFILLIGGAVLLSRSALPGDALYGVKRASENTQYSLAGGNVAKGKLKLEFAARRIGEVADLIPRATSMSAGVGALAGSGALNSETTKLVHDTLGSADDDVRVAAQLLGRAAVQKKSAAPLTDMTAWTPQQLTSLRAIVNRIPAGSAHDDAVATRTLVKAAQVRAATLKTELNCSCLATSGTDDLGPRPCATGCSAGQPGSGPSSQPGSPGSTSTKTGSTTKGAQISGPGSTTTTGPAPGSTRSGTGSTSPGQPGTSTSPGPRLPSIPLPTLPNPKATATPILPIGVDSCGLHASLAGIGINIGGC